MHALRPTACIAEGRAAARRRRPPPSRATTRSIPASRTRSGSSAARRRRRRQPEISVRRVTPGYFRTMARAARARTPLHRCRSHERAAGRAHQRSRGAPLFRRAGAARQADQLLGGQSDHRGRHRQRAVPGTRGGSRRSRPTRRSIRRRPPMVPACSSCARAAIRRALIASVRGVIREQDPALAVFGLEPFAETVSRSVARAPLHHARARTPGVGGARPGRDRRPRRAELQRGRADARDRHPHGARRAAVWRAHGSSSRKA